MPSKGSTVVQKALHLGEGKEILSDTSMLLKEELLALKRKDRMELFKLPKKIEIVLKCVEKMNETIDAVFKCDRTCALSHSLINTKMAQKSREQITQERTNPITKNASRKSTHHSRLEQKIDLVRINYIYLTSDRKILKRAASTTFYSRSILSDSLKY